VATGVADQRHAASCAIDAVGMSRMWFCGLGDGLGEETTLVVGGRAARQEVEVVGFSTKGLDDDRGQCVVE